MPATSRTASKPAPCSTGTTRWTRSATPPASRARSQASATPSFAYQDFQYFLTQGNGPWGNRAWTYDKIGNRLTFARSSEPTQTYAYASPGHNPKLSTITPAPGWGSGAWSFSHDAAGNQTSIAESNDEGAVQTTIYDFAGDSRMNAMRTASPVGPARTDVLYDGRGFLRQAHLTVTGSGDNLKVTPLYSSAGMLMARTEERTWTGGTTGPDGEDQPFAWLVTDTTQLFYFAGRPVAQLTNPGAELLYITTDHLGTPALVTNGGGTATWAGGLEPFGAPWTAGLDRPDPEPVSSGGGGFRLATAALERLSMEKLFLRYPGQWSSDAFRVGAAQRDVYYNVHRWYQPGIGRYERPDPLGLQGGSHLLNYATSNPMAEIDPLGLQAAIAGELGCSLLRSRSNVGMVAGVLVIVGGAALNLDCDNRRCGGCSPPEHAYLQTLVDIFCGMPRSCAPGQDLVTLQTNRHRNLNCAIARGRINKRCFGGGDAGHQRAEGEAWTAVARCELLLRGWSFGGR